MSLPPQVRELLRLTALAIEPYRNDIVLIGGIAKQWYCTLDGFADPGFGPTGTIDVDLALPEPLAVRGMETLHQRLVAVGLVMKEISGLDNRPAITRYYLPGTTRALATDPYLECLVAMRGPDRDEPGAPQGRPLLASAVRFLDLVTADSIEVDMDGLGRIRIPHPFAYIVQKTRIRPKRRPDKQPKDLADIFYVAVGLRSQWDAWSALWHQWRAHSQEWNAWLTTVDTTWREIFASGNSVGSIEVASIVTSHSSDAISRIMRRFQEQVSASRAGSV